MLRILIAGAGRVGLAVGAHLRGLGHEITIVDRDAAVVSHAFERHGLVALSGDATDASLLESAEIGRADVVVAMLRRDADNLAVALLAKAAGVERIMVRMRDKEYRRVYLDNGVDRVLSEIEVLLGAFATPIEHEAVRNSMVLGEGGSIAFELSLPHDSRLAGMTVSDIAALPDYPPSCVFAGLIAARGEVKPPRGASQVQGGMALLLVAQQSDIPATVTFFLRSATGE